MNETKDHIRHWLECDCGAHAISVDADSHFGFIDMAFWQLGSYLFKCSIKNRFLFAWNMVTTGRVYSDMVSLNREETQKLIEALLQSLEFTSKPKIKEKNEII